MIRILGRIAALTEECVFVTQALLDAQQAVCVPSLIKPIKPLTKPHQED